MGNSNAIRHGRFTAEAITERRRFAELIREMKDTVREVLG